MPASDQPRRHGGRPRALNAEALGTLQDVVREHPHATQNEILDLLESATGVRVSKRTLLTRFQELGIVRVIPPKRTSPAQPAPESSARLDGYRPQHREKAPEARYPMGLSDAEWKLVADVFESKVRGVPRKYSRREMVDAMVYVVRGGVPWRMLPIDFPPWHLVFKTFRRWSKQGRFQEMTKRLGGMWRTRESRSPEPTGAIIDSQSVATTEQGGPKGYDAGKKVKGRKRHLLTDTLGLILAVVVHAANIQDCHAAEDVVAAGRRAAPTIQRVYADSAYAGKCKARIEAANDGLDVEIVRRPNNRKTGTLVCEGQQLLFDDLDTRPFPILPKRWVIERTNGWNMRARRLARDQDRTIQSAEAWIWLVHGRMLLTRLTHA